MFVVMSDSHTDRDVIKKIKKRYEGTASALFHCGDSELPSNDDIWQGINVVAGNYTVTVTDSSGCVATKSQVIKKLIYDSTIHIIRY